MELWIRSQNKSALVKCDSVHLDSCSNYEGIYANLSCFIGKYPKERALEILDEIQRYINNGCKQFIDTGVYHTSKYEYRVYQMPKE